MLLEALIQLRLRLDGRERELFPGQPIHLPSRQARKFIQKAVGKVRSISPRKIVGTCVRWGHQNVGVCEGEILLYAEDGWVVVSKFGMDVPSLTLIHLDGTVQVFRDFAVEQWDAT